MNKEILHPTDLACFNEVADVIGYDAAVDEMQKVMDSGIEIIDDSRLFMAFKWSETPQGDVFWRSIHCGHIPEGYTAPVAATLDEAPKFADLSKLHQEHFLKLIEAVGYPPEDATHVDWDYSDYFDPDLWLKFEDGKELFCSPVGWVDATGYGYESWNRYPIPQKPWYNPADVAFKDKNQEEYTGGSVNYYKVKINNPTTIKEPYEAECNDIIEALQMNYAEGNAFKAIWRKCAARLGNAKKGYTDGLYDSEKVVFFGQRMVEQCKANESI